MRWLGNLSARVLGVVAVGSLAPMFVSLVDVAGGTLKPSLAAAAEPDSVADGEALYQQNCAKCHGVKLEGQPNWKERLPSGCMPAPPHDPAGHTWHHSDDALFNITKLGPAAIVSNGYESDMPGFADVLTDSEIIRILHYIESTWPERQRAVQQSRK
jgi:mono/diheme cytochrome c family protein